MKVFAKRVERDILLAGGANIVSKDDYSFHLSRFSTFSTNFGLRPLGKRSERDMLLASGEYVDSGAHSCRPALFIQFTE